MSMKKSDRVQLKMSEAIKEIHNRTGLPEIAIKRSLENYIEIVKECLCNEVEVVFGDLGYFGWKHWPMQKNKQCRNPLTGETYIKDFPAYNVMSFRQKNGWKKEMRIETSKLFPENKELEGETE